MTLAEYKQLQVDRSWKRIQHYWDVIRNLEESGEDPKAKVFDVLAGHLRIELARVDFWVYDENRFFFSSDNDIQDN